MGLITLQQLLDYINEVDKDKLNKIRITIGAIVILENGKLCRREDVGAIGVCFKTIDKEEYLQIY